MILLLVRLCVTTFFATLIASSLAAKNAEVTAAWDSIPINIDGNAVDWRGLPAMYLEDQNASVAMSNDDRFVYLLFRTNDIKWARAIKATGFTVYLDPKGGKKKDIYVKFKGGPSREELMKGISSGKHRMPMEMETDVPALGENDESSLYCFIKDRITEKMIPLNGDEGPAAAFDTSKGFYLYELRVPLTGDSLRYYGINAAPGAIIGVSLEWGDMSQMMRKRPEGMGGSLGMGPGGGGPPGGGMGGGMSGRRGGDQMDGPGDHRPEMPKKQEVYLKTTLASQRPM